MSYHAILFSSRADPLQRSSGAHRIATYLREHEWDVEVVDFAAHWDIEELKELVKSRVSSKTIFFGFSTFFTYWNPTLAQLTKWMKETYPDIKTVLGGQSVALTPANDIDYWVDSFGEVAMLELAKSFTGGSPTGIRFDTEHFGTKKLIKAIQFYPAYPLESYKNILEKRDFVQPYEWLTIEFSRGCKFNCAFCNFPILGVKGDYSRTQDDFEYEMKYNYDNFGVKNYYVADETFNDRVEKIIKFADVVEQRLDFKPYFSSFMRADLMISKPESWEHLVRLGMGGHYYGVESMNHASAKVVGKGMHPDKLKAGLIEAKKYFKERMFYRGTISLIVGLPYETPKSMAQSNEWLNSNWDDQGLVIFPLDVDDISTSTKKAKYSNVSDFSKNLIKYGIREMQVDKKEWGDFDHLYNWRDGNWYDDVFMWEHDTMNILQARDIAYGMQNTGVFRFKLDNWQLGQMAAVIGQDIPDLRAIENISKFSGTAPKYSIDKFLRQYIDAKLNYLPS